MPNLNVLTPIYKDYLWGGNKLPKKYNKDDIDKEIVAESWELSTQPDDAYARMNEHDNGKTELWYVVEADENAYIYLGLKQTITKEEFYKAISTSTITDYLNKISVKKDDVFLVEPVTLHSIGEGCLIAGIQENQI